MKRSFKVAPSFVGPAWTDPKSQLTFTPGEGIVETDENTDMRNIERYLVLGYLVEATPVAQTTVPTVSFTPKTMLIKDEELAVSEANAVTEEDKTIETIVETLVANENDAKEEEEYVCDKCGKTYTSEKFYKKHVAKCDGK